MGRVTFGILPDGGGGYQVILGQAERQLLRSLGPQMRDLLDQSDASDDLAVGRLFPPAYTDDQDEDRQTEYRLLVHDELRASHLAALELLERSAGAEHLTADEVMGWMRALNVVRLVLGTRLDITEEGDEWPTEADDPRLPGFAVYDFLTTLQAETIEALGQREVG